MSQNIPLEKSIIFGPIRSRRLGQSLGINLLPTKRKYCSYDCVYCFFGSTPPSGPSSRKDLPTLEQVTNAIDSSVEKIKQGVLKIDYFTFAGNGEPTLNPSYPQVVDYLLNVIRELQPRPSTAIFTNGSQLWKQDVLIKTAKLDQAIVKIDVVNRSSFKIINRPKINISLDNIVRNASRLPNLRIQTAIMKINGRIYDEGSISYYCRLMRIARPLEIQIYNVIFPPAVRGIEPVTKSELEEFADKLRELLNFKIVTFDDIESV